jgi:hypothetical protein
MMKRLALVMALLVLVTPLMLAKVFESSQTVPIETSAQIGSITGQIFVRNYMGDFRTIGFAEVTAEYLDGDFSVTAYTRNNGVYIISPLPNGRYKLSVYSPYGYASDLYYYEEAEVAIFNGYVVYNFYLDVPIPEFADYAFPIIFMFAILSSALLIKRMKNRTSNLEMFSSV